MVSIYEFSCFNTAQYGSAYCMNAYLHITRVDCQHVADLDSFPKT